MNCKYGFLEFEFHIWNQFLMLFLSELCKKVTLNVS